MCARAAYTVSFFSATAVAARAAEAAAVTSAPGVPAVTVYTGRSSFTCSGRVQRGAAHEHTSLTRTLSSGPFLH